ncbi:MAG: hypothetical protein HYR51_12605 [Candidatus Rokubacteria bacterium]|nr:hypothetical protein [Candidatus Rokubacteria bacterium]
MISLNETPLIAPAVAPEDPAIFKTTATALSGPPETTTMTPETVTVPQGTVIPGSPEFKLAAAVFASVEHTNDGVVIASVLFEEDGYGRTYEAAWADFVSSLRDKLASLEKREAKLAAADRAVLEHLRKSISPAA